MTRKEQTALATALLTLWGELMQVYRLEPWATQMKLLPILEQLAELARPLMPPQRRRKRTYVAIRRSRVLGSHD